MFVNGQLPFDYVPLGDIGVKKGLLVFSGRPSTISLLFYKRGFLFGFDITFELVLGCNFSAFGGWVSLATSPLIFSLVSIMVRVCYY